jgi:hypothetical protein
VVIEAMTQRGLARRRGVSFHRSRRTTTMTTWMRRVRLIGAVALGVACVQLFGPEAGGTAAAPAPMAGQAAPAAASAAKTGWYL